MKFSVSYLAGLFDGEGCIFIARRSLRRNMVIPYYVMTTTINMTHRPLIEALAEQFDCNVLIHRKDLKNIKHRVAYEVVFASNRARDFLTLIYDELVVKKEEARLALIFQENLNAYRGKIMQMDQARIENLIAWRERIRLQVKACKKVSFLGASDWNVGELGGHPMPGPKMDAEGQYRTKQELTTPGVRNEQVPTPKGKICSVLHGNVEKAAEMTASDKSFDVEDSSRNIRA